MSHFHSRLLVWSFRLGQTREQLPVLAADLFLIKTPPLLDGRWVRVNQHALLPACYCQSNRSEKASNYGSLSINTSRSPLLSSLPVLPPTTLGTWEVIPGSLKVCRPPWAFPLSILIPQVIDGWIPKRFRWTLVKFQLLQMELGWNWSPIFLRLLYHLSVYDSLLLLNHLFFMVYLSFFYYFH